MDNTIKTGKDAVVIGKVSGDVGDGSVVIGPTDNRGNTIINQPMAVGRGAKAGPGSIAIGAGACAGSDVLHLIDQLDSLPELQSNQQLISAIRTLRDEVTKKDRNQSTIKTLWGFIQVSATASGAISLVQQIGKALGF